MATVLDIGIDLGTSSVVIHGKGKGSVLNEPAVIAVDRDTRNVLAVGEDAHRMLGRAPGNIQVMRPLAEGMIADFDLASAMLRYFVTKVVGKHYAALFCDQSGGQAPDRRPPCAAFRAQWGE